MKKVVLLCSFLTGMLCAEAQMYPKRDYGKLANYDESKVPEYVLPDALLCNDGEVVTTKEQWEQKRRPEVLQMFTTYMFGKAPELKQKLPYKIERISPKALDGRATRKEITLQLTDDPKGPHIDLQIYLPNQVKGKVPVFLGLSFMPNFTIYDDPELTAPEMEGPDKKKRSIRGFMSKSWQLDELLKRGYGLATFCYNDVDPDFDDDFQNGVHPYYYKKNQHYPAPDEWGSIAAWAWGLSRAMDYLETDPDVDAGKVAVMGHSRLGKAAVWAGAADTRFALVISANSGCCGVAISRRAFGETVEAMNISFPHWFCSNYKQFNDRERYMPFDQHQLVALVAPRPIYIASAEDDNWSDQRGEFLGGKGAESVYALYGLPGIGTEEMPPLDTPFMDGPIAYHIRKGPHAVLPFDWEQFLTFADRYLK
ncbi:MAG: acetylxylan esterase [Mediterranea massiliensis]|nr:acetylxylan esterase [Mediterranea massiliensis]